MMKRFYKVFGILLLVLPVVILVSCGGDDSPTAPASCGGVEYGGYCWYYGNLGESCDTVCANAGGCNANGITYAGSQGAAAACDAILNALGVPADTFGDGMDENDAIVLNVVAVGCSFDADDGDRWIVYPGTCDTSLVDNRRACACNQ